MPQHYYFQEYYKELNILKFFCISLLVLLTGPLRAQEQFQDKIYLDNEAGLANIEIFELNKKKLKARNQEGKEFNFKTKNLLMVFKGDGQYLTFPANPEAIKNFLSLEKKSSEADLIITLSGQLIPAGYIRENGSEITYHHLGSGRPNNSLASTDVAAIIYKEGKHKLFASPGRAARVLAQFHEKAANVRSADYPSSPTAETNPFSAENSGNKKATAQNSPPLQASVARPAGNDADPYAALEMDPEEFSRKALLKTADLGTYLGIISDRRNSMAEAGKAVDLAVKLFINENAQFEVSGKEGKNRYKVRAYLNKLKLLEYDKIEISWTDISYVSNLKKGIDGNYYGVITLQQHFKGYMDNQVVYSDLTEKNIEVMVKAYQKERDGTQQQKWDIFLSDVGVVVTKFDR